MANYYYKRYSINYEWETSPNNSVESATIKTNQENVQNIAPNNTCTQLSRQANDPDYQNIYLNYEIVPDYSVGSFTSYKIRGTGTTLADLENVTSTNDDLILNNDWYGYGRLYPNNYISSPSGDPSDEFYTYSNCGYGQTWDSIDQKYNYVLSYEQIELHTLQTQTIYKNKKQGSYVDTIVAADGTYPDAGFSGSYYYEKTTKPVVTLSSVGDKSIDALDTLSFSLSASIDGDSTISYSVSGLPSGANFNTSNGDFSWTPTKAQGGTYNVTFTASSNGSTDSESITITVNSVYPVISAISDKSVDENENISFAINTNDPDFDTIECYLASGQPAGSTFNFSGTSGSFEWDPTYMQSGTYTIVFEAEANGYYTTEEVVITVNEIHKPPESLLPVNNFETENRKPTFEMTLPANHETDDLLYHARLRIADNSGIQSPYLIFDSKDDATNWEYFDGTNWVPMSAEGVPAETNVRIQLPQALNYSFSYWDAATWESDYGYSLNSNIRKINILISTNDPYVLDIEGAIYNAYSIIATEASNGEIGSIDFTLNNEGGIADNAINYGDTVLLAINDELGNQEQFRARVKQKNPSSNILEVKAITGDGILSERIINTNYTSQDIGLIAKDIIDNYCSPLTSDNINTSTGIISPISADGKTPLKIFENLRREYGILYFVDAQWDVNFYLKDEINQYQTTLKRGD